MLDSWADLASRAAALAATATPAGGTPGKQPASAGALDRSCPGPDDLIESARQRLAALRASDLAALDRASSGGDSDAAARAWSDLRLGLVAARRDLTDASEAARGLDEPHRCAVDAVVASVRCEAIAIDVDAADLAERASTTRPAEIALSDSLLAFGTIEVGTSAWPQSLWLRNVGPHPVTLDQVTAPGDSATEFPVTGESRRDALASGEAARVEVTFRPQAVGARSSRVDVLTGAGVPSASVAVAGTGASPSEKTRADLRVATLLCGLRADLLPPPPRTFDAMRDLIQAAGELDGSGHREAALRSLALARDSLDHLAGREAAEHVFSQIGVFTATDALAASRKAVAATLDRVEHRAPVGWDFALECFDLGREAIEVLTGESHDAPRLRALEGQQRDTLGKVATLAGAVAGGSLLMAALPALAVEAGTLGGGAGAAVATGLGLAASHPGVAQVAAGTLGWEASDLLDRGPRSYAEHTASFDGVLNLLVGAAQVYGAHLEEQTGTFADQPADEAFRFTSKGEASMKVRELRSAGAPLAMETEDVEGAPLYIFGTPDGERVHVTDAAADLPPLLAPPGPLRALGLIARSSAARVSLRHLDARAADSLATRDGEHIVHLFDRVVVGAGHAAVIDAATLSGHGEPGGVIAIAEQSQPWRGRKHVELGQPPDELVHEAHAGHQPGDLMWKRSRFTSAAAFSNSLDLTRKEIDLPVLRDHRVTEVTDIADKTWAVAGAQVRSTVRGPDGTFFLYSRKLDIAGGPGRGQRLHPSVLPDEWHCRLVRDGRLVYGEEIVGRAPKVRTALVSGGGGTGAWSATELANRGARVDWVGRPGTLRDEELKAELVEIDEQLGANVPGVDRAALERRKTIVERFGNAMVGRNLGIHGAFAHPKVALRPVEIVALVPSEYVTEGAFAGRDGHVHARFSDGTDGWYDTVVVAHGLDPEREGGAVAITRGVDMVLEDVDGYPLLRSASGAIRVLGAAVWAKEWKGRLQPDERELLGIMSKVANKLPKFSKGVHESFAMASRQITAANNPKKEPNE